MAETSVHFPTAQNLLWDAVRAVAARCDDLGLSAWRQHRHVTGNIRQAHSRVRKAPHRMRACLDLCEAQLSKAEAAGYFAEQARIQIDPIGRRAFRGEDIPHAEKVFSIFEPHTRWMTQGKAGVPQELGVPVCIVEDQHQFILHHEILWAGGGTDCAVPVIARAQARFPARVACSFDKGFHSPANQDLLGAMLEQCALPRKGGLSRAAAAHEGQDWFRAGRQRHAGVESAISHLEHCGLARVRDRGRRGFARAVAASCKRLARQQRLRAA